MNTISLNGTQLADVYIDTSLAFNKPDRVATVVRVPGRNGDLIFDGGKFNNVTITYPAYIKNYFPSKWDTLINTLAVLKGYQRIECSNDATHYRLGQVIIPQSPKVVRVNQDALFNLSFNCKPQRFLLSGETIVTKNASGTIDNPTAYDAKPLIRIYGTGTVTINGVGITLSQNSGYTDVDCEMMDCYNGTTSRNQYVSFSGNDFPVLSPGSNVLTFGTGITQIRITPRWWEL